jgi:hypothetical protein
MVFVLLYSSIFERNMRCLAKEILLTYIKILNFHISEVSLRCSKGSASQRNRDS